MKAKEQELKKKLDEEAAALKKSGERRMGHAQHLQDEDDIQERLARLLAGATKVNSHPHSDSPMEEATSDEERPQNTNL